ncbi:sodium- and chloride-dependent GABA transporter 1 isoform X2 [Electrophorus electricus]|uniref:sodium- and chloride-dependent GABA transporter 1 isoform X2 n=1 Tax=Electrophorus electricus TaxID=8005 RepID=UPI000F09AC53|nr:sodium- and chloride-dependent GABA transporter 1 isoform X2 [Electrophorus electricus]
MTTFQPTLSSTLASTLASPSKVGNIRSVRLEARTASPRPTRGALKGDRGNEATLALKSAVESAVHEARASPPREAWSRRLEFVLASVGYAVGLGNVWRFPYLCYRSGGGAFLIPYIIMLFLCGIPLLLMEYAIGQYTRLGPVHGLAQICPLLKGVGLATVVISFMLATYYNVLMTWALYYLFHSFGSPFPWQSCNNTWNAVGNCSTGLPSNASDLKSASQQFFDHKLLEMTNGIEEVGGIRWELFGLLVLTWIITYLCIFKGVKSTGKVVYFTATFPYFMLFALLINNVQLPGAKDGILFFLLPDWGKLLEVQVWVNAAAQIFNSIGIAFGSMISMASYNKFSNNILRDTFIVSLSNSATSILAGFVIFSGIGYMAHIHNLPVEDIATDGPGLVFVVYPEAFSTMPVSKLWAPLFFFMLLCLGLDSEFAMVEVAVTCIMDGFGPKVLRVFKRKELLVVAVCAVGFLLGIPHITRGGIYVFQLMDHYTAVVSLMFLAFFEVLAVTVIFGVRRICVMVENMLGRTPHLYFRVCWQFLSPLLVLGILISSIVQYTPARYGKSYTYPQWAEVLGWFLSLISIVWIPLGAAHEIWKNKGPLLQRLKVAVTPTVDLEPQRALSEKEEGT